MAHGFTRPTQRARSPYRAHGPPTCTLTRNSAAIAPYQRVRRVIHGRLPPKFCEGDGFACRAWEPWALRARALTNLNMVAKASGPESVLMEGTESET